MCIRDRECPERLLPRAGAHQLRFQRIEDGLQGKEVVRPIIDHEDAGRRGAHLWSQTRNVSSSWSISTGLVT